LRCFGGFQTFFPAQNASLIILFYLIQPATIYLYHINQIVNDQLTQVFVDSVERLRFALIVKH